MTSARKLLNVDPVERLSAKQGDTDNGIICLLTTAVALKHPWIVRFREERRQAKEDEEQLRREEAVARAGMRKLIDGVDDIMSNIRAVCLINVLMFIA